jgi:hypothetical protein
MIVKSPNELAARTVANAGVGRAAPASRALQLQRHDAPDGVDHLHRHARIAPDRRDACLGENREVHGILDGYLLEWDVQVTPGGSLYGRLAAAAKDLLDLGGLDPPGFVQFHRISHTAAFTLGYLREISHGSWDESGSAAT